MYNVYVSRKSPIEPETDDWWEWKHNSLDRCKCILVLLILYCLVDSSP